MVTTIHLKMQVRGFHGVDEQERRVGNDFAVSLSLQYPFDKAMASDNLDDTISYADVAAIVREQMAVPSKLLEHVVGRIRREVLNRYPAIRGGRIAVAKLNPPIPGQVEAAVEVEW